MSIRKNWSALSSLTRQWTVEDDEEVERERRRKTRTFSTETGDSPTEATPPTFSRMRGCGRCGPRVSGGLCGDAAGSRRAAMEEAHGDAEAAARGGGGGAGGGPGGHSGWGRSGGGEEPGSTSAPASVSDITETGSLDENGSPVSVQDANVEAPAKPSRLFVSSLSISMDKGPTSPTGSTRVVSPLSPTSPTKNSRVVSPISPTSPARSSRVTFPSSPTSPVRTSRVVSPISPAPSTGSSRVVSSLSSAGSFRSISPEERVGSPAPEAAHPITQNGGAQASQNGTSAAEGVPSAGQMEGAAFQRQNPRALSFRMVRKKEEPPMPLQRSASVRITSKATQASKAPGQEEDRQSPFQRNSRQRVSSRTIQEKMERLALAVQKSESVRSPTVSQQSMYVLMDEVTRKRGLFEKDPDAEDDNPGAFRQDFRNFSAGISERINRWVSKSHGPGSLFTSPDLRNVDITKKRNIWENRSEEAPPKTSATSKVDK
ncbi:hypothetical protein AAFF_G00060420 [Aldrovandia affinis]|uniref:Uncharacterized protein n=1 Tax=Aldrovandia affinis TaxID=143900 RepID=A0AAD7WF20_9TELE|nr:hypothetical protein AAFF_G00060420 [Aldrovandia affinis]